MTKNHFVVGVNKNVLFVDIDNYSAKGTLISQLLVVYKGRAKARCKNLCLLYHQLT